MWNNTSSGSSGGGTTAAAYRDEVNPASRPSAAVPQAPVPLPNAPVPLLNSSAGAASAPTGFLSSNIPGINSSSANLEIPPSRNKKPKKPLDPKLFAPVAVAPPPGTPSNAGYLIPPHLR
eukprot:CAMPEP_0176457350 /NCGR_PEP_ID=MMETSP0127-20121128/31878_1 /TAXON_ID=938130 /ORGANISM="Platyophrya macrostoma, Strain WH" /LENGTH=119 /DNA_ID=CAMNT_0017847577 /DNA_START=54 /DNA_END=409 /DNA_ORIENTATION=-